MAKLALIIGISEYDKPGLNPLPAAVKDVAAMERILKAPDMGGFDEVTSMTNLTTQMQYEIEKFFSGRAKEDLVLLYFSGHGIKDDNGRFYFATRITEKNARNELIRSTAVPATFVHEVMKSCRAQRQVIILDCCFSGAFDPAFQAKDDGSIDLKSQLGAEGRVVLTSSSSTQYSFEQQGAELSIYTRYLVEGIETGAGDRNRDGSVSMLELHEYASSKVQETAPSMTPKIIVLKDKGFEIALAKTRVTDPKLVYFREVEKYAQEGEIIPARRRYLNIRLIRLGLSAEEATEIENKVLQPYRDRIENLKHYREALEEELAHNYPLSDLARKALNDLYEALGLRDEDIEPIEQEVTLKFLSKSETYQQNLNQYEQALLQAVYAESPLSQEVEQQLRDLLASLEIVEVSVEPIRKRIFKEQQDYQRQLERYKWDFIEATRQEYPIGEDRRYKLKQFQQTLGLRDEDIIRVEAPILERKEVAYRAKQEYQQNLRRYEQEFSNSVQQEFPLSDTRRVELEIFQRSLGLKDKDVIRIQEPLLAKQESEYYRQQLEATRLREQEAEKLHQQQTDYQQKLYRYEKEFLKAVQAEYPLNEFVRTGIKNFQKSLGLRDEDVIRIEQPILTVAEARYQEKLKFEEAERQRLQESERLRHLEWQKQQKVDFQSKLRRYEQVFSRAIQVEYPLSSHIRDSLSGLQQSLQLTNDEVVRIEQQMQTKEYQRQKVEQLKREPKDVCIPNIGSGTSTLIGIDIGTCYASVAVIKDGKAIVLPNDEGFLKTPSVVACTQNGQWLVGLEAQRQAVTNPKNTFTGILRFLGRDYNEVTEEAKQVSYNVVADARGKVKIECPALGKQLSPEEIVAKILDKIVKDAKHYLNQNVSQIVLTSQNCTTTHLLSLKDAARLTNLEVLRICSSTLMAAIAYGSIQQQNETILVVDIGGGHLSASILEIGDGVYEVLSVSSGTCLGGKDFDKRIVDHLAKEFKNLEGLDLSSDSKAMQRLLNAAEKAKISLSDKTHTEINLPWIATTGSTPKHLKLTLTRDKLNELISDLIDRFRSTIEAVIRDAKSSKESIDKIILVGGSSQILSVHGFVKKLLGEDPLLQPLSSMEVSLGGAIQSGILSGNVKNILALDVLPFSLKVKTLGRVASQIISRNTTIATKKSEIFTTTVDNQTQIGIQILEGEGELAENNKTLGLLWIDIPPAPKGTPQVEVIVGVDANGLFDVTVKDKGTGLEKSISITRVDITRSDIDNFSRTYGEIELFNQDLTFDLLLSSAQIQNGVEQRVELDDGIINVKVPAGVKVGQRIRIRGKGKICKTTKQRGDLYLIIIKSE
jgi:molecular chaperone DnaK (HSP70)